MLPDPNQDEPIDWAAYAEAQPIDFVRSCEAFRQQSIQANREEDERLQQLLDELAQ